MIAYAFLTRRLKNEQVKQEQEEEEETKTKMEKLISKVNSHHQHMEISEHLHPII